MIARVQIQALSVLFFFICKAFSGKVNHCQLEIVNPKSISVGELYGHSDKFTLEWKNGILASILLSFCVQTEADLNNYQEKLVKEGAGNYYLQSSMAETPSPSYYGSSLPKLPDKYSLTASSCRVVPGRFGMSYPACAPVGWRWAMLDGPVDSEWIENLNSVLDDSMMLCLSNGERIRLMPGSRILFESDDLSNASPATVSRCAVIFLVRNILCNAM